MGRRALRARALFAAIAAVTSVCTALTWEPAGAATAPGIDWRPCRQIFECGTLDVPLDHDDPGRASIPIAVVRLPATDPGRRIGSLFLNPGGPGGSGVDFVLGAGPFLFTPEVRARFDLVGFDPRGVARSRPLLCFESLEEAFSVLSPFPFPVTDEEETVQAAANRALVAACDQRAGPIIDHMATADVARDLDLLRQAVGDDRLTYAGYSYGSYLGVTYANLFPDRVRALVVDGVLDPVAWSTGRGDEAETTPFSTRLRSDAGAQATLEEFFRLCDAGGDACAFSGGAADRYAALAARLRAAPVEVVDPDGAVFAITYADLVAQTLGAMYDSFSWPELAQFLADLEALASPAELGADLEALAEVLGLSSQYRPRYPNFVEAFPGVACSDSDNPDSYGAWSDAADASEAAFGYFGRLWTWVSSICAEWNGFDEDRYMGPFDARTANPVLVVGTRFDPATRYQGAVVVHDLLPRSSLLTVEGWGHTSLFISRCADRAVARYLLRVVTPAPGTVCQPDVVPFTEPALPSAEATAGARATARVATLPRVVGNQR